MEKKGKVGKGGWTYLQQPIASTMEGGDDGGVDVAAIQTLERGEERRGDCQGQRGKKKGGSKTKSQKKGEKERTVDERRGEENSGYTHLGCIDYGAKAKLQTHCTGFFLSP